MTTHESPARREARCKVVALALATPAHVYEERRMRGESPEQFKDRVLRIAEKHPFEALAWIGG